MHQSIQIAPELSRKVSKIIKNQKPAKRTDQKGERIQEQKLQKVPAELQQPERMAISLTSDHLFVQGFLYVLQETWSKDFAVVINHYFT